ncbi:cyclopropane mycolic acid synthase family methyltransferase [Mycobacterium intracellulare]|uniref:Cyclopropane-fatty-acyl-phospholipid synthase 2 CmaA2 n=1 Tax=Mycobacterium intracellulare (strain ATCC 13950 / DSM 43223 / JCM 6384 / NCTC 13025 / 3600) TaxID=487521 RepID=H8IR76_MYCIA|nr:cyclopropane mycolic acid synthase family methyltransferase [Mycobacterium intracellulare]AFC43097.1 cyclopropane-fatty-acyl-phospholipid synthase 2 CmaA2 [Mycobacterium intracellulare ATCC 13950]ETZ36859.1 cyclopropane mycolic acid synthase 2 [Mycobacterium intracellulare MIN_061107_1834]MCA2271735.1 class I SAM-dependent methyltransferase [Mycobacterium intracellulare]MCA2323408.1 class I SAM-dependent methyltransferase [Mycobacterium intracellulare]MCA2356092.1 class I SAM-dependent meth
MTHGHSELKPNVDHIQSHYDWSNEFFRLWLDPSMTYSCAYFERDDMTLEEAQRAKIDLALGKLGLRPGMTLLDIGCGWGSTMRRAVEKYDVNVIGLTLSENQLAHCRQKFDEMDSPRFKEVRLHGWEDFDEPVDRIVSLGAFEHFADGIGTYERYADFFKMCYNVLPEDGVMLLHSIVLPSAEEAEQLGLKRTMSLMRFISFIRKEIYPGGRLPMISVVDEYATGAGFQITRHHRIGSNYVRTLDTWAKGLEAHKDEAIELKGQQMYETFMKYLTGCRELFRDGYTDVCQFTMEKRAA